jgi:hypothetical protein
LVLILKVPNLFKSTCVLVNSSVFSKSHTMNKKILFTVAIISIAFISKAQTWSTFGTGAGSNGTVYGLTEYNGNLIMCGDFDRAGGNPAYYIAQWNGTSWSPLGTGLNNPAGLNMVEYNGNLIAGGQFTTAGSNPAYRIAQWNGTTWSAVGAGMNKKTSQVVWSLANYNGNLIAGGYFDSAGGQPANNIASWNGISWSTLGSGISNGFEVFSLAVYNGELYAGGYFDSAGGQYTSNIAKWNGTSWSAVGMGIRGNRGFEGTVVYSLCVYRGNLYAGGVFDTAGSVITSNIAMWNGTTWSSVGGANGAVYALTSNNGELFAGGGIFRIGSVSVNSIAQWDGHQWYPLGTGVSGDVWTLSNYNSNLVAGGQFTSAGSTSCGDISEWIGAPYPETSICYVTVDTASKYNEVLWDKTGVDTTFVDSVRIYSKGFTSYNYLGSVSIHDYTQYVDLSSQPNTVSSTYEICTVDTNGLVSLLSAPDQTILLQANVGVGNTVNLSWNPYSGDTVTYYVILRDSTGLGDWQRFDSVPNNIYAYTDNHPPISSNLRYVVNTVWNLSCIPYATSSIVRSHSAMSSYKVTSRSNTKQLQLTTGIPTVNSLPSLSIYPNPVNNIVTINMSQHPDAIVTLNNVLGQVVYSDRISGNENVKQLNLSGINDGVYFLKLALSNGSEMIRKIEVVK